jgi:hypothetical protein
MQRKIGSFRVESCGRLSKQRMISTIMADNWVLEWGKRQMEESNAEKHRRVLCVVFGENMALVIIESDIVSRTKLRMI